ncbi:MAG: aminoacyl-tRNA hydrolase [Saprospiraceae bacterium]|nr:aminoacyl-tRNA hydrolase [Saprospiraceae bacterium]
MKALERECKFKASRSSGSGGQHVNKVSTRVELFFDISNSKLLSLEEKAKIRKHLKNRINKEDILVISSQDTRSQALNKNKVYKKFEKLIHAALKPQTKRKELKPLSANPKKRLAFKRKHSEKKEARKKVILPDGL